MHSTQVTPRSASHAFITAFVLLSGSVLPLTVSRKTPPRGRYLALLETTMYDLGRTWIALTANGYSTGQLSGACIAILLHCLRNLLPILLDVTATVVNLTKVMIFLCQVLTVALENGSPLLSLSCESEISLTLLDISSLAQNFKAVLQHFSEYLLPTLSQAARSKKHSPTLIKAIQVSLCFIVSVPWILITVSARYLILTQ